MVKQKPTQPDTTERLRRLIQKEPGITGDKAAERLGISSQRVYQIAKEAGFKRLWSVGP
jgi:predicted ArsR family transcriptional regulator